VKELIVREGGEAGGEPFLIEYVNINIWRENQKKCALGQPVEQAKVFYEGA
jgi:hypothetical protein